MKKNERGIYVFAICSRKPPLKKRTYGEFGNLHAYACGSFIVIGAVVDMRTFNKKTLREKLEDNSWAAQHAALHYQVTEELSKKTTLIPLRFGVIFHSLDALCMAMQKNEKKLRETLARLESQQEWSLAVSVNTNQAISYLLKESKKLQKAFKKLSAVSPGKRWFEEKSFEQLCEQSIEQESQQKIDELLLLLEKQGKKVIPMNIQDPSRASVIFRAAVAVSNNSREEFLNFMHALRDDWSRQGIDVMISGPFPPYMIAQI